MTETSENWCCRQMSDEACGWERICPRKLSDWVRKIRGRWKDGYYSLRRLRHDRAALRGQVKMLQANRDLWWERAQEQKKKEGKLEIELPAKCSAVILRGDQVLYTGINGDTKSVRFELPDL